jgi:thymidylate synthase (FAD)
LEAGYAEEHARGILPFDYRQHFVVSFSLRAFLHFLDLRAKLDAQQEIRALCDLMWPHLQSWAPQFADWYGKSRLHKARLAP